MTLSRMMTGRLSKERENLRTFKFIAGFEPLLGSNSVPDKSPITWLPPSSAPKLPSQESFLRAACGVKTTDSVVLLSACNWYLQFLETRIREAWVPLLRAVLRGVDSSSLTPRRTDFDVVMRLLTIVIITLQQPTCALTDVVDALDNERLVRVTDEERSHATQLVFVAIGWLSMIA